ncbi:phasin family protein [Aurantimonas sp. A3-2-R12]|uniref:phasin family protein n=1 Tax=Aurantimonas sp. A3-2-R12 TaxID=3114362 RepID=UPI002E186982|nr:phasin family protein [Aurantimonas sp. A3-2-R12]
MPNTSVAQSPSPAVLRFRGLDLEAMIALQMRNIEAIRRMANLMLDSAGAITERQAALRKSGVTRMNATGECMKDTARPQAIFERQTEASRELIEVLAAHVGALVDITAKSCAGPTDEGAESMTGASAKTAGADYAPTPGCAAVKANAARPSAGA